MSKATPMRFSARNPQRPLLDECWSTTALIEDDVQGVTDVVGPGTGNSIGELEERLDQLHAAGSEQGEALRELFFGVGSNFRTAENPEGARRCALSLLNPDQVSSETQP